MNSLIAAASVIVAGLAVGHASIGPGEYKMKLAATFRKYC